MLYHRGSARDYEVWEDDFGAVSDDLVVPRTNKPPRHNSAPQALGAPSLTNSCDRSFGQDGWGPKDVLPYFKKTEDQERGPSTFHGVGGPLRVSDLRFVNPMATSFLKACKKMGLKENKDFNDWSVDQEGFGTFQV